MDFNFINKDYVQNGDVCAMASYGIIIEYFSKGKVNVTGLLNSYIKKHLVLNPKKLANMRSHGAKEIKMYRESEISIHFHSHCNTNGDKRGFDYITEIHNDDLFNTRQYCNIKSNKALSVAIAKDEILRLREDVKNGGLAMVLYLVNENIFHSIVVGFDEPSKRFFKRDTNSKEIVFDDFLLVNSITEYILFNN